VISFIERTHAIIIECSIYRRMQGQNTGSWCWAVNLTADSKQWKSSSETTKHIKNVVGSPSVPF